MPRLVALAAFVLAVATACGGEEKEKEQAAKACGAAPAAMSGTPRLPDMFPTPAGVTYTSQEQAGPSRIVHGYVDRDIDGAFDAYRSALGTGGYTVDKDEHEEVDAEVNFSGHGSSGQVKLVQECSDRTTVTITARPQ